MSKGIVDAVRHVIGFLVRGMDFESGGWSRFESEVKALIVPHLPVLAHRRARLLDGGRGERWSDELDGFMEQRLWPLLGEDRAFAERNRTFVTLLLDVTIAAEQSRDRAPGGEALPLVRAFDASWAS